MSPTEADFEADYEAIDQELRLKARRDHAARISLDRLDAEHHGTFVRAINNVLSTDLAIFTYAQIIDGLPTEEVAWDTRLAGIFGDHPIDDHVELCPGATEKARELCRAWRPEILLFNPKLVNAYQQATPGSKAFQTRLIELVAVAIHQFGVILYQLGLRLHQGDIDSVVFWRKPLRPGSAAIDVPPRPTLFNHSAYLDDDIYPEGVADIVGYWAENRILGGVVVFDRRAEDGLEANSSTPPNVYFHPERRRVTFRVFQLCDDQEHALVDFLLSGAESPPSSSPLPILADRQNRVRVDAHLAIIHHMIYRDIWERKPPTDDDISFFGRRPQAEIDYPEVLGELLGINVRLGIPRPERAKE